MSNKNYWLEFKELASAINGRKVIFWGCFDYFEKTIKEMDFDLDFLVDSSKNQQGEKAHHGYDVKDPSVLKNLPNKTEYYVIVTASAFYEITDVLIDYGFTPGTDFCVSPVLYRFQVIEDIYACDTKLLFSSSDSVYDSKDRGGGIYLFDSNERTYEKKISGITRGFCKYEDKYFVVDALSGVKIFDRHFEELDSFELPKRSLPHGLVIDEKNKLIYVVLSALDQVAVFDLESFRQVKTIMLTDKNLRTGQYYHHFNDICLWEESLYISMFSYTGNVDKYCFDGAIAEYDLHADKCNGALISDLWQPHSPKVINSKLTFLDSMRGNLLCDFYKIESHFNGFVRGVDFDGRYFFVGQSVHRYFDRMAGTTNNIAMDPGLYIYDNLTKLCRFIPVYNVKDINTVSLYSN